MVNKLERMMETLESNYIQFEDTNISVIIDNDDNIWFCAMDVASALEYKNTKLAIQDHVDIDDKIKLGDINTNLKFNQHPFTVYINESGIYSMALSSKMEKAKKFKHWVTSEVLPTIRKYNYIELRDKYDKSMKTLGDQINYLKKQNQKIKNDLKKDKYPDGAVFYVLDYTDDYLDEATGTQKVYRIGIASDMKSRKALYDTHMLHNKKAVIHEEMKKPEQFEICMKAALYEYRYADKKSFYICSKKVLTSKFKKCEEMLNNKKIQKGGGIIMDNDIKNLEEKYQEFKLKIKMLNEQINEIK